jgi:3-hydroxyisobutyrate dehydrogenase-like beta-hydroxyacid dehydrogenase
MKTAFLGLGVMGFPMAGHLKKGGHEVTVYNRTQAKAQKWAETHGGKSAATPAEAAKGADIVFSCVGNDDDLRSIVLGEQGAFAGMAKGAIFVDHTTASANVARELGEVAQGKGVHFLDAPVSGGQAGAENGKLTVMVGGGQVDFDRVKPVIDCYARACVLLGPVGSGQLAKMVNQICIAGLVQGLAEGMNFAVKAGLDRRSWWRRSPRAPRNPGRWRTARYHGGRQVRLRLRRRLDAQGPRHLPRRGEAQRRPAAGHRPGGPVLRPGPAARRQALGHLQPDPSAGAFVMPI